MLLFHHGINKSIVLVLQSLAVATIIFRERVLKFVDEEISIGDYVLTGGEIPAMVLMDAVARLIPGVVGDPTSVQYESFSGGLLDYPQFTRPAVWRGMKVPDVLLSGHHGKINRWREEEALKRTRARRPDLINKKSRKGY